MLPRAYLAQKLTRPLPTKDGGTLRTIGAAAAYIGALPKERKLRERWQTSGLDDSTAPIPDECQFFLDNVVAQFGGRRG